ncbi:MAG: FtsK/SpoIIIE domain-containing protein [Bacillota bacterium]
MTKNSRSSAIDSSQRKLNKTDELTSKEILQNGLIMSAIIGVFCGAWLFDKNIQQFFNYLPREWVLAGFKYGLGIPTIYVIGWILIRKHRLIWLGIIDRIQKESPKSSSSNVTEGILRLLPAPPKTECDRSGQGYGRQIPAALEHVGLTHPGQRVVVKEVVDGPAAARIVISLPSGLRLSRIENATRDIQAAIGAPSLQIQAGPSANTAAIIVTHRKKNPVVLIQVLVTEQFKRLLRSGGLPVPVGVNEVGEPVLTDLTRIAHLLVAGATGAGKSWWINAVLITWIMFLGPDRLRLLLIDPKRVELSQYSDFPHVVKVVQEPKEAVFYLKKLVSEMDYRYTLFTAAGVRNISGYRKKTGKNLPYIACVIDELADLMIVAGKQNVEPLIQRLAQLARACGIHMIVATQRPSVDVITGVVKANLPSRICFRLAKSHDYMTILDDDPRVTLTGKGDGLAAIEGEFGLIRFQSPGVGVSDEQFDTTIEKLKKYWKDQKVQPAELPGFMGTTTTSQDTEDYIDDDMDINLDPDIAIEPTEEAPNGNNLEERLKRYIQQLVVDVMEEEDGDVFLPPIATIARELGVRRSKLDVLLPSLEADGWISPVERIGKANRRRILIEAERL